MIPGVTASQLLSLTGAAQYADALAYMDFFNGLYGIGATELTAADVIDLPGLIGAAGLAVPEGGTPIEVIGDWLTTVVAAAVANNLTLVCEYEVLDLSGQLYPFYLASAAPSWDYNLGIFRPSGASTAPEAFDVGPSDGRYLFLNGAAGLGISKAALTRTAAKLSASHNGTAVVTNTTAFAATFSVTAAAFGGLPDDATSNACTVRKLIAYAAVDDSELPALSAL